MADDSRWKSLYSVGGWAALLMAVFVPLQIAVFVVSPPPTTAVGWFALFQRSWLLGLLDMDLLLIVDQVLFGLILLALYVVLRRVSDSWMAIAGFLAFLGIAAYFASAGVFEMLSLSRQYATATTEVQRSALVASGQTTIAVWQGSAFNIGYVMLGIALLIVGFVMWRSPAFGRFTAGTGIVVGVMSLLPPTAGIVGMVLALGSLLPLEIWAVLVGVKLVAMGRRETTTVPSEASAPSIAGTPGLSA